MTQQLNYRTRPPHAFNGVILYIEHGDQGGRVRRKRLGRQLAQHLHCLPSLVSIAAIEHGDNGGRCFAIEFMRKGLDYVHNDPALIGFIDTLKASDPKFADTWGEMSMMTPLMANKDDVDRLPAFQRVSTKIQKALMGGVLSAVGDFVFQRLDMPLRYLVFAFKLPRRHMSERFVITHSFAIGVLMLLAEMSAAGLFTSEGIATH